MKTKGFWVSSLCLAAVLLATGCPKGRLDYKQGRQAELQKDYDTALIHYERAFKQDPNNIAYQLKAKRMRFEAAQMHVDRGHKLRDQGHLEAAIAEFEKALAIDPSSFVAEQELRATLEKLAERRQAERAAAAPPAAPSRLETVPEGPPQLIPLSRAPINLRLTAESRQVFESIGKLAGINVIFDPEFQGRRIPVELSGATLEQALDIVALMTKTFWKPVTANTIMVIPDTRQKRQGYEEQIIKTIYLSNITTPAELNEVVQSIRTLLNANRIVPSTSQNAIIIRDTPDKVAVAEKIIRDIDRAKPEVLIQVAVLQARRDRARELGILPSTSVPLIFTPPKPSATGGSAGRISELVSSADYSVVLPGATALALVTDSTTKVIQNPEVRATDGQTAKLRIGDSVPFAVGSFQPGIGGVGINPLVNTQFQFKDVGVNLDITPRVNSSREISLKLVVEVSSVTGRVNIGGIDQPIFGQRRVEHDIRLREGEVNILGGLVERTEVKKLEGWPGLSQIPILRYLFGSDSVESQENELLIVLTPRILRLPEITPLNLRPLHVGTEETVALRSAAEAPAPLGPATERPVVAPEAPAPAQPAAPAPQEAQPPAEAPQIRFAPAQVQIPVGEQQQIELAVAGVQDLFAIPLVITFDPKVVELVEVNHGGFLAAGGEPVALVHRVDAESGTLILSLTRPPGARGVSGSGTLATLVFRARAAGQTLLSIVQMDARNTLRGPVTLTPAAGEIVVP